MSFKDTTSIQAHTLHTILALTISEVVTNHQDMISVDIQLKISEDINHMTLAHKAVTTSEVISHKDKILEVISHKDMILEVINRQDKILEVTNHKDMILDHMEEVTRLKDMENQLDMISGVTNHMISEDKVDTTSEVNQLVTTVDTMLTQQLHTSVKSAQADMELLTILVLVTLSAVAWVVMVIISTQDLFQSSTIIWQVQSVVEKAGKEDSSSFTFESHLWKLPKIVKSLVKLLSFVAVVKTFFCCCWLAQKIVKIMKKSSTDF